MELPELKDMLCTTRFLMDEETGQFYAVYGNTYQRMCTEPRILDYWTPGGLLDELAEMRHAFGYAGLAGPTPSPPPKQLTSAPADDIIPKKSPPKCIPFTPPTFSLEKLTTHLTMDERVQVYHDYIYAISDLEHNQDLINRLRRSEPHNIPAYEDDMNHHMHLHEDVLGRLLTILKQDDYYRMLEDLPVIESLWVYDKVQLFPELYDTMAIIERVTSEVDLIEKKLRRPGMYPSPQPPIASTSGFVPRPSSRFQPITPAAPSPVQMPDAVSQQIEPHSNGISPGSSLPCGQDTPMAPVSSTSIPSQHKETYMPPELVIPPQPSTSQLPSPNNTHHQQQYRQPRGMPHVSPIRQPRQQLLLRTQINPSA